MRIMRTDAIVINRLPKPTTTVKLRHPKMTATKDTKDTKDTNENNNNNRPFSPLF